MKGEHVVIDAAALLDLMVATDVGRKLDWRLEGCALHAPGHIDAEVLTGLGRLEKTGVLGRYRALNHIETLRVAAIERHPVATILEGAWRRRGELPVSDALYFELARSMGVSLITTNPALAGAAAPVAELIAWDRASET